MKTPIFIALLLLLTLTTYAQVGIGTTTPDPSAQLDVVSPDKGILVPRVTSTTAVTAPAEGLLVYQTGEPKGYYLFSQGNWQRLITEQEQSIAIAAATTPSHAVAKALQVTVPAGDNVRFNSIAQAQASTDITLNQARDTYTFTKTGMYSIAYSLVVLGDQDRVTLARDGTLLTLSRSLFAIGTQNTLLTNSVTIIIEAGSQLQLRNSSAAAITVVEATINITRL